MEKSHVSKHPTLEVISETEPNSHNTQRTNYMSHEPTHSRYSNGITYETSTNRLSMSIKDGHRNQAYNGSTQTSIHREGSTPSVGGVYREQYWICSEPLRCRNWTKRERILFFVLLGLSTVVLGLVAVISFVSRNANNKTETPPSWLPWL